MAVKIQGNKIHLTRGDTLRVTVNIIQRQCQICS